MVRLDILTILPEVFDDYLNASILARAQKEKRVKVAVHDLRGWTTDRHRTVDDKPYGGGAGMILKVAPVFKAVEALKKDTRYKKQKSKTRVILTAASGKQFDQRTAERWARRYDRIILICGRYEGVDHRVATHIADEEVSIGPYVLTGGELPALVMVDAVTRLLPGVIKPESLADESFSLGSSPSVASGDLRRGAQSRSRGFAAGATGEYPHYTRPEVFHPDPRRKRIVWRVPKVLLSGDHRKIAEWRERHTRR